MHVRGASLIICAMAASLGIGYWGADKYLSAYPEPAALEEPMAAVAPQDFSALARASKPIPQTAEDSVGALPPASALAPPKSAFVDPLERAVFAPPILSALPNASAPTPFPPLSAPREEKPDGSGFVKGAPAFVRIFKKEAQLELWLKRNGRYALFKTFPICKLSGHLGPKEKYADYQSPEGFYSVSTKQLNPHSGYHRAFNIGYPNAYDRQFGRTGDLIMVHGDCRSVGCFAMTNKGIDEIYNYVEAALRNGQRDVPVHIFPFRMSEAAIKRETNAPPAPSLWASLSGAVPPPEQTDWSAFWRNLKEGYDYFERTGEPPIAYACRQRYGFSASSGCQKIAGW